MSEIDDAIKEANKVVTDFNSAMPGIIPDNVNSEIIAALILAIKDILISSCECEACSRIRMIGKTILT
jgi:hypothetical protein